MRHLHVSLPASMHRFVLLLFILGLGQSIYAASIFQFPDLTRRLPERTTSPGCAYKGDRYDHGERVPTAEPCLNCTCIRAVLVCYLRVCPTSSAPRPGCFAAREVGECCPSLVCGGADLPRPNNKSESTPDLRPTFQPIQEETTVEDISTTYEFPADTSSSIYGSQADTTALAGVSETVHSSTVDESLSDSTETFDSSPTGVASTLSEISPIDVASTSSESSPTGVASTLSEISPTDIASTLSKSSPSDVATTLNENPTGVASAESDSSPTGVVSTVSDSTFHTTLTEDDSLVYITSTQEPTHDYDINFFNDIPGGCMVNGTLYGDGSAMLSSTFCEYCFCIRGKSTCLKPKCHLAIDGCIPFYDTHYSCCPSRYDCSQRTSLAESTASSGTTLTSTTLPETTEYSGDPSDCIVDGTIYHQGEVVPDRLFCHNCYCSDSSVVCEKIKCSPPIEGCQPIIPEGHCCPVSYRCDYQSGHSGSNSIKGSNLNDSVTSADSKGTDIKAVKNYYMSNNAEVRLKAANDRESIALLHNVIPIHRRLDENTFNEQNSTAQDIDDESPVYIGYRTSTLTDSDVDNTPDHIRENDKTLDLELNDTTQTTTYSSEERMFSEILQTLQHTTVFQDEPSSTETVLVGSPEVHTLSIQELFDQFFSRHHINASKFPDELSTEPKRNNSKQPSSIVEIYDSETDIPNPATARESTMKLNTTPKINNYEEINTDASNLDTGLLTSSYSVPINLSDSTTEQTADISQVTNYNKGTSFFSQVKTGNDAESTVFPAIKTQNTEIYHMRTDTEPTYPVFISTGKNGEGFEEQNTHSTLAAFTSSEDFNDQDFLETTLSQIFTTASNLYNKKLSTQAETHSTFPGMNTRHIYSETPKQTHTTLPVYTTSKNPLIEELKIQAEAQPVVFIYDSTRNLNTDVSTKHSQTQTTSSLHGTTINAFPDHKKNTETQPISLLYDTTENTFRDESIKQTDSQSTSPEYTSTKNLYSEELKKQSETLSTSPVYTSTRNIDYRDQTETHLPFAYTSTNSEHNDELKKEIKLQPTSSTDISTENSDNAKQETQTDFHPVYSTLKTIKPEISKDFEKKTEIQLTSPVVTSTTYLSSEGYQEQTDTNPTSETSLTSEISNAELKKGYQPKTSTYSPIISVKQSNKEKPFTTVSIPLAEISTPNNPLTTESTKLSTRINSKLPSFNYIEKANEKNSSSIYTRHPVLTDSVVNVYLPAESRNSVPDEDDFTNVGSIYIGAPLSVGGTNSRKEVDKEKPKITQSGGVIFMDPKYTDIDTKTSFFSQEKTQNDADHTVVQNKTSTENTDKDSGNNERKKGPRIQDVYNQSTTGQGFKIIPFVAEDAIRGQFGKLNNTLVLQQGSTEGLPDMVSDFCFIKGRIYMNGEMIGKPDPCELCRCFYGRELCQIQRCPTPPDCIAEKVPGFCCPRFTCGNNSTSSEHVSKEVKPTSYTQLSEVVTSTTRKPDILAKERNPPTEKQEMKFGIRVRTRPTQRPPVKSTEHTTEKKILMEKTTTIKPEIRTFASKPSVATTTTTSKKPNVARPITSKKPETKRTTTTTQTPLFPDPWGLLKVSGCNIYGKFFNINDQVEILSGPCSHCICTSNGVECNDIC